MAAFVVNKPPKFFLLELHCCWYIWIMSYCMWLMIETCSHPTLNNIKFFPFLYSSLWSMPNTTRENLCLIKYEIWAKSHFNFLYQYSDYLIQGHFDLLPFLLFYIEYIFRLPSVHLFCMSILVKYFAQNENDQTLMCNWSDFLSIF